jgi:hypothetical protein
MNLFLENDTGYSNGISLYLANDYISTSGTLSLFVQSPSGTYGAVPYSGNMNMFMARNSEATAVGVNMYLKQLDISSGNFDMSISGANSFSNNINLYSYGISNTDKSFPLFMTAFGGDSIPLSDSGPSPLLTGLISYYKLDDTSDSQGANTLVNNSIAFITGKIGNAAQFTATNGQSLTSSSSSLRISNGSATINMWVYNTVQRTYSTFVYKNEGPHSFSYILYRYSTDSNQLRLEYWDAGGAKAFDNDVFGSLALNTWYMITLRFDFSGNEVATFVNGGSKKVNTFSGFGTNNTGETDWTLGNDSGNDLYAGLIDEVGFWGRALTDAEITQLYNLGNGLTHPFT